MSVAALNSVQAFEHVLVATDFASSSSRAVHFAAELASELGAQLTVLHVIQDAPDVYPVEAPLRFPLGTPPEPELTAKRELDAFVKAFMDRAPACKGAVRFGDPAREIVAYAEDTECDLIILGTHGRRRLARWLLGSVAEKVVRISHVPVITLRADDPTSAATVRSPHELR
jgi:nucleotide-binding universal stress UspA family protein